MGKKGSSLKTAVVALAAVALAGGCSHLVHVEELDARFAGINSSLDEHAAQLAGLTGLAAAVADLEGRVSALEDDLAALRRQFEECGCGGMALGLPVYFDFNEDAIRDVDMPVLDEFARVMQREAYEFHKVIITCRRTSSAGPEVTRHSGRPSTVVLIVSPSGPSTLTSWSGCLIPNARSVVGGWAQNIQRITSTPISSAASSNQMAVPSDLCITW